jgi:hypothetical protein
MGNTYKNVFVRSVDQRLLIVAVQATGRSAYLVPGTTWTAVVPKIRWDGQCLPNLQTFAQACSSSAACVVLSAVVYDSDYLLMDLWRDGVRIGGYGSSEDITEPAFTSLTPDRIASELNMSDRRSDFERVLERKKSKRNLELAVAAFTKEYEGRWKSEEFREKLWRLVTEQKAESPAFLFAEDQHQALCDLIGLPVEVVGVDYRDIANGEAAISAVHVKANRTRR